YPTSIQSSTVQLPTGSVRPSVKVIFTWSHLGTSKASLI
ncbi:uncharacterized protein METZ01_LOCUS321040, partial [marine metagenome]